MTLDMVEQLLDDNQHIAKWSWHKVRPGEGNRSLTFSLSHHIPLTTYFNPTHTGTHATIFAIPLSAHDRSIHETKHDGKSSLPGWLACKTVYDDHPRLHPHDVKVEIRILSTTRHENVSSMEFARWERGLICIPLEVPFLDR